MLLLLLHCFVFASFHRWILIAKKKKNYNIIRIFRKLLNLNIVKYVQNFSKQYKWIIYYYDKQYKWIYKQYKYTIKNNLCVHNISNSKFSHENFDRTLSPDQVSSKLNHLRKLKFNSSLKEAFINKTVCKINYSQQLP